MVLNDMPLPRERVQGNTHAAPHIVSYHGRAMASVPGSPGQLAKVLTLVSFDKWEDTVIHKGKEHIQWTSVDEQIRKVELTMAMQEGSVPAKLLALYTIPKEGLSDTARAAMALIDENACVQSYHMVLEELTEQQTKEVQKVMKCEGVDMVTLEGLDVYRQLAVAQEVQRVAKGGDAKVVGDRQLV